MGAGTKAAIAQGVAVATATAAAAECGTAYVAQTRSKKGKAGARGATR